MKNHWFYLLTLKFNTQERHHKANHSELDTNRHSMWFVEAVRLKTWPINLLVLIDARFASNLPMTGVKIADQVYLHISPTSSLV